MGCYHGNCRRYDRPDGWPGRRDSFGPPGPGNWRKPCCGPGYPPPRRRPDYFDFPRFY